MDNAKAQQTWAQAAESLFCGRCKAARLMIWEKTKGAETPQHATAIGDAWVAIHCDYFKRRIEQPGHLARCGAFQKREDKRDEGARVRSDTPDTPP